MDQDARTTGTPVTGEKSPDEIRAEIDETRGELGDTVEALAAKTDVKARAEDRVNEAKAEVKARTPDSAQDLVAKVRANPLPLVGAGALAFAYWLGRRSASR
jgi:Protein of unknown function (DUF3618)